MLKRKPPWSCKDQAHRSSISLSKTTSAIQECDFTSNWNERSSCRYFDEEQRLGDLHFFFIENLRKGWPAPNNVPRRNYGPTRHITVATYIDNTSDIPRRSHTNYNIKTSVLPRERKIKKRKDRRDTKKQTDIVHTTEGRQQQNSTCTITSWHHDIPITTPLSKVT